MGIGREFWPIDDATGLIIEIVRKPTKASLHLGIVMILFKILVLAFSAHHLMPIEGLHKPTKLLL